MRVLTIVVALWSLVNAGPGSGAAQSKKGKLQLADLPAGVQQTVRNTLQGGEIKNIGREKEDGIDQYEIETVLNGKSRDFNVDTNGKLLVLEEETAIEAIPAAAKARILNKIAGGRLTRVETLTKTGQPPMFEAAYTDKAGKTHEFLVKADGTPVKD